MTIKIKEIGSRQDFIGSLALAVPEDKGHGRQKGFLAGATEGGMEAGAAVDAGSTISFIENVPKAMGQDCLNSTLLAQLAANAKFDRENDTEAWYGYYRTVLENVGWVTQSFGFSRFTTADATMRMDKVCINIMRAVMSGNELLILEQTLQALSELPQNEGALTLFDAQSSQKEAGNFQLGTVTPDPGGNAVMSLGSFYFKATEHRGRFLWVTWKSESVNFYTSAQKVVLNEDIYGQVRQSVINKLGPHAKTFVDEIDLGNI